MGVSAERVESVGVKELRVMSWGVGSDGVWELGVKEWVFLTQRRRDAKCAEVMHDRK